MLGVGVSLLALIEAVLVGWVWVESISLASAEARSSTATTTARLGLGLGLNLLGGCDWRQGVSTSTAGCVEK